MSSFSRMQKLAGLQEVAFWVKDLNRKSDNDETEQEQDYEEFDLSGTEYSASPKGFSFAVWADDLDVMEQEGPFATFDEALEKGLPILDECCEAFWEGWQEPDDEDEDFIYIQWGIWYTYEPNQYLAIHTNEWNAGDSVCFIVDNPKRLQERINQSKNSDDDSDIFLDDEEKESNGCEIKYTVEYIEEHIL